jgi:glycolate oxidase
MLKALTWPAHTFLRPAGYRRQVSVDVLGRDTVLRDLASAVPPEALLSDPVITEAYRYDEARFCPAGVPLAVVRPTTTTEVSAVLRVATAHRIPVVAQGARTGLAGAANAIEGGIVLSLGRMDRILHLDPVEQIAVVQPGVINGALQDAAAEHSLFYAPDPASFRISTLGGNLGTGAGGLRCVKYGVTRDAVRALEVVLADGEVLRTGTPTAKGVAGYDLTRLLVGSEGTLGIITEATLALQPLPEPALTLAALFPTASAAMAAVSTIMAGGPRPALLEFLDRETVRAVQSYRDLGLPTDAGALLIAQSDRGTRAADDLAVMAKACLDAGASETVEATDSTESELLLEARRLVHWGVDALGSTLVEDVCVPRGRLVDLVEGLQRISAEHGLLITCAGHAGDGNMHPTVVFPRGDPEVERSAYAAFEAVMALGLELGGTITGEHGVGLLKRDWLARELSPTARRIQLAVKQAFDPLGILNPGKVL